MAVEGVAPIRDDAAHRAALKEIDRLWGARKGTPPGDRLDVLMTLVDQYERTRWPDKDLDPIDAIRARMENSGRTRKDFEKIVGSSGRASEVLNRKRPLTLAMIWKLVQQWKMPAEVLVQPYSLSTQSTRPKRSAGRRRAARSSHVSEVDESIEAVALYRRAIQTERGRRH